MNQDINQSKVADCSAEIGPVLIEYYMGNPNCPIYDSLDVTQCSNETKGRILRGYIDDKDFD